MKKYELLYIIPVKYTDTEVEEIAKNISAMITEMGNKISSERNLGKIKLAYPINNIRYGYYILVYFDAETDKVRDLETKLRLSDEVLRHQIVVAPENAEKIEFQLTSYQAPDVFGDKRPVPRRREETRPGSGAGKLAPPTPAIIPGQEAKAEEPAQPKAKPAPTMTPDELDKKLDDILDKELTENL